MVGSLRRSFTEDLTSLHLKHIALPTSIFSSGLQSDLISVIVEMLDQ